MPVVVFMDEDGFECDTRCNEISVALVECCETLYSERKKCCARIFRTMKKVILECNVKTFNYKSYSIYDGLVALKRAV
jgi:hypothetical protein